VAASSEATTRRIVTGVDPFALQAAFTTWLTGRPATRGDHATTDNAATDNAATGTAVTAFGLDGETLRVHPRRERAQRPDASPVRGSHP
jgi:hypothetical protein